MSGFLSSAVDIVTLFQDGLGDASFAGLDFIMINHQEADGRRALRFLFPGTQHCYYEDLGADSDPLTITGFYAGDDYVEQAAAFRKAFFTSGPQTLVHPWLGTFQVVLAEKGKLSFTQDELRVLRIEMRVWVDSPLTTQPPDTLAALLSKLAAVKAQVQGYLEDVLAVQAEISGAVSYVTSFVGGLAGAWSTLALTVGTDASGAPLQAAITALGGVDTIPPGTAYPDGVAALLAGPSGALAAAANPPIPAAVAPGTTSSAPVAGDPVIIATCLVAAGPAIAALPQQTTPGTALATASLAYAAADLASVVSDIPFTSQQDAAQWLVQATTALDQAATAAAAASVSNPLSGGALWRALIDARTALADDMTATIGRLPAVQTLVLPAQSDLWSVAQYLAGDDPTQVLPTYLDLRTRNDVINPAIVAGPLEVLM